MSQPDEIREFVYREYIEPARKKGLTEITIRAGDVHDKMGLANRMPAVIGAIETNIFKKKYELTEIRRNGSANGPNVYFIILLTRAD